MSEDTRPSYEVAREKLSALLAEHGITIDAVFVPWSKSRSYTPKPKETDYNLNWHVTLKRNGRDVFTADYSAGCGHCPCYKSAEWPARSHEMRELIKWECEHGKPGWWMRGMQGCAPRSAGKPILPSTPDVVHSLLSDAEAIDYARFEDWAREFGYDEDSRKGEAIYRACLECGLALRAAFGDALLSELRELAREL